MYFKKFITQSMSGCVLALLISVFSMGAVLAQTPDGETPANEGVCDDLIGRTPGLYGLCVGFCEAQDCEATFDPLTGEVTFDESCKPSSPKLLENYNKRKQPGEPDMPCVNVVQGECPCWTEAEIALMADGEVLFCVVDTLDTFRLATLFGSDAATGNDEFASVHENTAVGFTATCSYLENFPASVGRFLQLSEVEEVQTCLASIAAQCTNRGF